MSALLATVLRQREAHCPVIRSIARELLTCLVMQPVMNLASPVYVVEYFVLHLFLQLFIFGLVDLNNMGSMDDCCCLIFKILISLLRNACLIGSRMFFPWLKTYSGLTWLSRQKTGR